MTNELSPVEKALLAAKRYHDFGEYANEDQRHIVVLALEIARLTGARPTDEPKASQCRHKWEPTFGGGITETDTCALCGAVRDQL